MRNIRILIPTVVLAVLAVVSHGFAAGNTQTEQRYAQVLDSYGKLPLSFQANRGQANAAVDFVSQGHGYTLWLGGTQATVGLKPNSGSQNSAVVRMKLTGANTGAKVSGVDELPGKANYFIGNNPAKWHTDVPTYARVKYSDVYPGVDLIYYGNQRQLEYDFVVQPHSNPGSIALNFDGWAQNEKLNPSDLALDNEGNLLVKTSVGPLQFNRPVVYQTDAAGNKHFVDAHYVLGAQAKVSFAVAAYDQSHALVIDPSLAYSTYLGGTQTDVARDVALDASGNAYIAGQTFSSDFPTTAGSFDTTCGGCTALSDNFVVKVNAAGSATTYSTYVGGSKSDNASAIGVDVSGNVYVAGYSQSTDFPVTSGAFQSTLKGSQDAMLFKLSSTGTALLYCTYIGGNGKESVSSMALDGSGNAYLVGTTLSNNYPTTSGAFQTTYGGGVSQGDAFVSKMNPSASGAASLVWSTYLGGSMDETGAGIALDASNHVFVTGGTNSTNFPTTSGAFQTTLAGGGDAYVTELSSTGTSEIYSTLVGGAGGDEALGVAVDGSGNAYVVGLTNSTDLPVTAGVLQPTFGGQGTTIRCDFSAFTNCGDGFILKLNSAGSALSYSTYLGGNNSDYVAAVKLDSSGNAYVTGVTNSTNYPQVGSIQSTLAGQTDVFVSTVNSTGTALTFSTYLGGNGGDGGTSLAVDSAKNIYVVGYSQSTNFPLMNPIQATYGGGKDDVIISKITPGGGVVSVSPKTITFNVATLVGTTTQSKAAVLTNGTSTALTINSITIGTQFSQTNNCGSSVPAGGSCTINVSFNPSSDGVKHSALTIADSDSSSPQIVNCTGTGTYVSFSKTDIIFPAQTVGTTSGIKKSMMTNNNPTKALSITSTIITGTNPGDYMQTNDCGTNLASGASCTFSVTFKPLAVGQRFANITITTDDGGSPSNLILKGTGQ